MGGDLIRGPAIIREPDSTIYILGRQKGTVGKTGKYKSKGIN